MNTDTDVKKKFYAKVAAPWQQWIVRHKLGALGVHWLFQGLLYMDSTERFFKLSLDVLLTLLIGGLLQFVLNLPIAIILGFLAAHSLNFLFNGQVYGVLKHFGDVRHTWQVFNHEVERLQRLLSQEPSVRFAAAYGSLAREAWSPTSDLDVRIVRAAGPVNGLRACWFVLRQRARAFWRKFPLDIFVLDDVRSLEKLSEKDQPVILVGALPVKEQV